MKFVTIDYVVNPTTHAKLGFQGSKLKWERAPIVVKYTLSVSIFSFYIFYVLAHPHRSRCRSYEHC